MVLYWQQLRGRRKQLVWTGRTVANKSVLLRLVYTENAGANHMKKFVENETVQRVFKEVALSRPCLLEGCDINNNITLLYLAVVLLL